MTAAAILAPARFLAGFPNPVGWAADKVKDFLGGVAENGFELVISGLTAWVVDAVVWVVEGVFDFFLSASDPNLEADWFVTGDGPYALTAGIGAALLVAFVLFGVIQGMTTGDVGGMVRRMALDLPLAVLGMVGLVTVTQVLIRLTDELSAGILDTFVDDVKAFTTAVASLSTLGGGIATAFVVFLLALVAVLAGIVLVAELVVRSALVYIVVALAPLVFAAAVWPALRGAGRRLLELLVALVVSKLVIAVALAVAAAAAVGVGSGGEVTALPAPEVAAEDPGGSVTQAVGLLLTTAAAFGVSAFSPLLVAKLLPVTEAAVAAQGGIRGGPVRAGQQAVTMGYYTRYARAGLARDGDDDSGDDGAGGSGAGGGGGKPSGGPSSGGAGASTGSGDASSGGGGSTAGSAGAGAGAVGVAVGAATRAASSGAGAARESATETSEASQTGSPERTASGPRAPGAGVEQGSEAAHRGDRRHGTASPPEAPREPGRPDPGRSSGPARTVQDRPSRPAPSQGDHDRGGPRGPQE